MIAYPSEEKRQKFICRFRGKGRGLEGRQKISNGRGRLLRAGDRIDLVTPLLRLGLRTITMIATGKHRKIEDYSRCLAAP
jgi:hypothetical protein